MAIVKMKRLRAVGMAAQRDALLEALQRLGCVQISEPAVRQDDPAWAALARVDNGALGDVKAQKAALQAALATLNEYDKPKGGLLSPRPEITESQLFDDALREEALACARTIGGEEKRLAALESEESKLKGQKASLAPWLALDVPLNLPPAREVEYTFGAFPSRADLADIAAELSELTDLCELIPAGTDREFQYLLLLCHKSAGAEVFELLKREGFTRATLRGWTGTAAENTARLDARLSEIGLEREAAKAAITAQAEHREALQRCIDRLSQDADRAEAGGRLLSSDSAVFFEGWVPANEEPKLKQVLAQFTCAWETADPTGEEIPQVPVKLKNNAFTAPLNVVTDMYSLPAYDGIDPNPLMAPFFIAFFGIMMADIGYGILMIAAALVVLLKTRPRESTKNFMGLVFLCGISTLIVGLMTGGFFGDFIPQLLKLLNPESTFTWFYRPLFTPLDNTVEILIGSLVLGAIQVFTGMTISVVKKIKDGEFVDALFDEITWWIILGGGALAIFGVGSVAGVPVVLAIGVLMLVLGGTRKAKGFGKVTSLIGLVYNGVTGFFSDILSYMRLMALMLAGSVIAQVFNTLASVVGGMIPGVGIVFFILISFVGNMLNLALNLLGCYVHDLRLQCLEFFNRFYKEGGKPFRPLSIQTKYVDILKEEQ